MHAMTSSSLTKEQSCKKLNDYFSNLLNLYERNMDSAKYWAGRGNKPLTDLAIRDALFAIGGALHPVMDNTSPAHEGFQKWRDRDFYRHGVIATSEEDTGELTPELLQKTIANIKNSLSTGIGVDCDCK